eukprot:SAG31_NODE_2_length_46263_cov_45.908043_1_plen_213_part_10
MAAPTRRPPVFGYGAVYSSAPTTSQPGAERTRQCSVRNALPTIAAIALTIVVGALVSVGRPHDVRPVEASGAKASLGDAVESVVGGVMSVFNGDRKSPPPLQPIKSIVDEREFRFLQLDNGLSALLISDPTTDESAAAMDVGFGSWDEPEDVPGLAHFCEHMSFMGSVKYPDTDAYGNWIENHGGGTNAYTGNENTNYYFGVQPDALATTLDR